MKKEYFQLSRCFLAAGCLCFFGATSAFAEGEADNDSKKGAHVYYLDASQGNDANNGLTDATAWKTLDKIQSVNLMPGDSVLLKRGSRFRGVLEISAQGKEGEPIVISAYGEGEKRPVVTAPDHSRYGVRVYNSDYVTVEHLEVINHGSTELPGRTGVLVECHDYGVSKGIRLNDLFVRDVNGTIIKKQGGGSGILISNTNSKGGKVSTYDGLTIEYCHIKNCYRNAMIWDGCWDRTNWYANKNVHVRYNLIEQVPGDGIVPIGCDGAIIEYNVMRDGTEKFDPTSRTEAAAGIWPWSCDNTIIRYNEASGHKAPWDGQGFDADYNCTNTVIEYNYSHDNWGGMVLVCAAGDEAKYDYCWGNIKPIVRYNISIGDGNRPHPARGKMFSPSIHIGGPVEGLHLYRNIIHNKKKAAENIDRSMLVSDDWVGCANHTTIQENVFYAPEESNFNFTNSKNNKIEGNYYLGLYKNIPSQAAGLPMPEKYEKIVTDHGANGLMQFMDSVTIAGGVKCVFVNKEKVEAFFNEMVPDPEVAAFATPYYWAQGAVGALPVAETQELVAKKSLEEAKSYLASVQDKAVQFDDTRYYRLKNYVRDLAQGNGKRQGSTGFMGNTAHEDWTKEMAAVSCHGADLGDAGVIWAFEKVTGKDEYRIKNLNSGLYLAKTDGRNASKYLDFTTEENAGTYRLEALNEVLAQYHVVCAQGKSNCNQLHASGAGVMNYNAGADDASSWYLIPATEYEVKLAKMGENQYAALYLPFDVTCADSSLHFYGVQAVDDALHEVGLQKMKGLQAGQGALLKGNQPVYRLTVQGAAEVPGFENLLSGVNEAQNPESGKKYFVLGNEQQGVGFYLRKSGKLNQNQAFLRLDAAESDCLLFNYDGLTGIESVVEPSTTAPAVFYDLSGRRVNHPTQGLYIRNGKKVYLR